MRAPGLLARIAGSVAGLILAAGSASAAVRPDPACEISAGIIQAWNLPTRDELGMSVEPYPIMGVQAPDGTYARDWPWPTAYVWERGGGKSLIKMPRQLGDYHVIAMCAA